MIWKNLPHTDRTTRGVILLAANSTQHAIDVANVTIKQLKEARHAICVGERFKTEVSYRMIMWAETQAWMDECNFHADDIYAFPELVFTKQELKQNPNINRAPLNESPDDAKTRRDRAATNANKKVVKFLKLHDLKRPGLSLHSFRHTNISEWESQGFPRVVCMASSGHMTEESYMKYASAAWHLHKNLSESTHDFWEHAGKERVYIVTKTQLYEALVAVIKSTKEETIAETKKQNEATVATVVQSKDEIISGSCSFGGMRCASR